MSLQISGPGQLIIPDLPWGVLQALKRQKVINLDHHDAPKDTRQTHKTFSRLEIYKFPLRPCSDDMASWWQDLHGHSNSKFDFELREDHLLRLERPFIISYSI